MKTGKLVVVLGMHRSGTSAITRGLQVLGVNLGSALMGPVPGINDKGFWEDIDFVSLNIEIMAALQSDWDCLKPLTSRDVDRLRAQGFIDRAVALIRQKVAGSTVFGLKDPRLAKLLPFWKEVFSCCQIDVGYVLALRHPMSVVRSLAVRNGFLAEKTFQLWLAHVIPSLIGSAGARRVVVDYDKMLESPDLELGRVARTLELAIDPVELQIYKTDFLDGNLRHTLFNPQDFTSDDACPPLVSEVYAVLQRVASDQLHPDNPEFQSRLALWSMEFERSRSVLALADMLTSQINSLNWVVVERDQHIANLSQAIAERDARIASLSQSA